MQQSAVSGRSPRVYALAVLAIMLAVVFVRLGFWQLSRLGERRTRNATLASRLAEPIVPFEHLRDTSSFRRARLEGAPDYNNEVVYTGRSRNGSPGVYLLTPIRRSTSDTAVIVIRGWVYAPDAATIDGPRWREPRTSFSGYVSSFPSAGRPAPVTTGRRVRALTREAVVALVPYPVTGQYIVSQDSVDVNAPARVAVPSLDDGPHLSYAIQWFCFAAMALGAGIVVFRGLGARGSGP